MSDDDIKEKVIRLIGADARRVAKPAARGVRIKGSSNVVVGGDVRGNVNVNTKQIIRPTITPPPGSLSPSQARRLQKAIAKVVQIEAMGGVLDGDRPKLFAKWQNILKDRFDVQSYREIPAALYGSALAWLNQVAAMNRPKLRRTDNAAWRNEHYRAIWARARQMGLSKGDVYGLVLNRLEKQVTSLKQLGEQSLHRLYEIVMNLR